MTSAYAFPYKTVPTELYVLGPWQRHDRDSNAQGVNDQIKGWDYDAHLKLARSINMQPASALDVLGLDPSVAHLALIVTAETGPTGYRWLAYQTDVPNNHEWHHEICFEVDSSHLSQQLTLVTEIVLAKRIPEAGSFTPKELGSRLLRDIHAIQLEGSLGRFPMEMVDFQKALPMLRAPHALWYLDWDPARPESQLLGTVLLYINSAHPDASRLRDLAEPSLVSALRCDIIRTMCQAMLRNEDFLVNYSEYDANTVGGQVREWLRLAFGDQKPEVILSRLDASPGRFEAQLQSTFN